MFWVLVRVLVARFLLLVAMVAVGSAIILMIYDGYNARAESVYCGMFLLGIVCYVVGIEIPE